MPPTIARSGGDPEGRTRSLPANLCALSGRALCSTQEVNSVSYPVLLNSGLQGNPLLKQKQEGQFHEK